VRRALLLILASAVVYGVAAWWAAQRLPETGVPMHVNMAGEVDRYATRAGAVGYFLGLGGFLLLLAVALVCLCWWAPVRFLNIPNKEYWSAPERVPTVRRMIAWDTAVLLSMPLLALSFIPVNVALQSANPAGVSASWIVVPIVVMLLAMTSYVIWMIFRRYRPRSA
jgi:hypothetical protein